MVPAGKKMCGKCLPETQPSDRLPSITPREVGSSTSGKPSSCPLLEHDLACPAKPDRLLGSAAPCAYPESSCAAEQGWGAHRELVGYAGLSDWGREDRHISFTGTCCHP